MIASSGPSSVCGFMLLVRKKGLEPSSLAALEPKSSASTNSATFAMYSHVAKGHSLTHARPGMNGPLYTV